MQSNVGDSLELTRRLTPILILFFLFLTLVMGKVLYLQIGMGEELRKQSQVNRIQHEVLPAQRGPILDRNGKVLAADEPVFNLVHLGGGDVSSDTRIERLAGGLDLTEDELRRRLSGEGSSTVVNGLDDERRIWFAEQSEDFPSFEIRVRPRRVYRFGEIAAPVLGYTGEISPVELDRRRTEGLYQGKYVGKTGIEKYYDQTLQGQNGLRWIETTATGERIRVLNSPRPIRPEPGDSVGLNLDIFLQKAVASSFPSDSSGAAVVMEIPSGKIRALYSNPTYDPNRLVSGVNRTVSGMLTAEGDPLHNRVTQSRFPPGSTFKIIPYLAALLEPSYDPSETVRCDGEFQLGDQTFRCWEEDGHGEIALHRGLIHSCNVFFYNLVRNIGYTPVRELSEELGFGRRTDVDLPDESNPQLSTPTLKGRISGLPWVGGDALNAIIGQGYTLISPIKQAQLLGSILTGHRIQPGIRQGASERTEVDVPPSNPAVRERLIETLDTVTDDGTGYFAQHTDNYRRIPVDVIGKTGTVQKVKVDDEGDTPPSDAWFVSAAPRENPRYVVVVFRAEAGTGGEVAAPHVREIYREMIALGYFRNTDAEAL